MEKWGQTSFFMRYVIDTYNLLHAAMAMGGPLRDVTVHTLCRYLAGGSMKATLVLDGRAKPDEPSQNEFPGIELTYSGTGVPADTVIGQLVELAPQRKKVTVVSDDRAIVLHARRWFANAMSCEQFLRLITQYTPVPSQEPAHKATGTPTSGESDHWMKEFGLHTDPNPQPLAAKPEEDPLKDINIEDLLGPRGA
jgi:hypothetical protein